MRPRRPPFILIPGLAGVLLSSCGSSPTAPSAPERVAGVWIGHSTLTSASGGECVGRVLQAALGSRDVFAALVRQTGSDLSATVAYQGNGTRCELAGRAGDTAVSLSTTSCQAGVVSGVRCSDGAIRDLQLLTARIDARAGSGTGAGTDTTTWNVIVPGTSAPVGVLTLTAGFNWNELGLPASDFHVFDGSILPGYVDGVVTIPEEANPFCVECGWFRSPSFSRPAVEPGSTFAWHGSER
jgi:hypothetical protein